MANSHPHRKPGLAWRNNTAFAAPVVCPTEFEVLVERLHLGKDQFRMSYEFRTWLQQNYRSRYVPEDILKDFGLTVF